MSFLFVTLAHLVTFVVLMVGSGCKSAHSEAAKSEEPSAPAAPLVTPVAYSLFDDLEVRLARISITFRRLAEKLRLRRPEVTPIPPQVREEVVGD